MIRKHIHAYRSVNTPLCGERGSNPHETKARRILSPVRLPIPPPPRCFKYIQFIIENDVLTLFRLVHPKEISGPYFNPHLKSSYVDNLRL